MIANLGKRIALTASVALAMGILPAMAPAQQQFQLHSTTFSNGSTLPLSTILNNQVNGVNTCSINGAAGGDESPDSPGRARQGNSIFRGGTLRCHCLVYPLGDVQHQRQCDRLPQKPAKPTVPSASRSKTTLTSVSNSTDHVHRRMLLLTLINMFLRCMR